MKRLNPTWVVILAAATFVAFASYMVERTNSLKESCASFKDMLQDQRSASRDQRIFVEVMKIRADKLPGKARRDLDADFLAASRRLNESDNDQEKTEAMKKSLCSKADDNALKSKYLLIFYSAFASIMSYWAGTRKQLNG